MSGLTITSATDVGVPPDDATRTAADVAAILASTDRRVYFTGFVRAPDGFHGTLVAGSNTEGVDLSYDVVQLPPYVQQCTIRDAVTGAVWRLGIDLVDLAWLERIVASPLLPCTGKCIP